MATYYKRKNGTYCVRVSNGIKDGRQELISATYKPPQGATKSAMERGVKEFASLFEASVHNGLYIPGTKNKAVMKNSLGVTVGEFIKSTYFSRISVRLSPNTGRFYHMVTEQFIIPSFGDIRLRDIEAKHLQAFIDYLGENGSRSDTRETKPLAGTTVKRYATVFSSVMSEAYKAGFIGEHPFKKAIFDYPKQTRAPLEIYDESEVLTFCEKLKNEPIMTQGILLSALMLGLRRAEIVALRWSDVNFERNTVSIHRSAYKVKNHPQGIKLPKSMNSIREVFFSDAYADILRKQKDEQAAMSEKATDWNEQDFIFTDAHGNMISLYAPTELCADFERRSGLKHLKFHGLRHTCASLMVGNGVDPETVKSLLGHDSLRTTDIYLHPFDKNKKAAADMIENLVMGRKSA